MATLKFAKRLAEFGAMLEHGTYAYQDNSIFASYRGLLDGLIEIDDKFPEAGIPELLANAMDIYDQAEAQQRQREEQNHARYKAKRVEAERRHELALQIACPTCGSQAGTSCQTRAGISKGTDDHAARYRAAADPA